MVNWRPFIAAEYFARGVAMLPNVSAYPGFVSFKLRLLRRDRQGEDGTFRKAIPAV
jgi:hypothetical protein